MNILRQKIRRNRLFDKLAAQIEEWCATFGVPFGELSAAAGVKPQHTGWLQMDQRMKYLFPSGYAVAFTPSPDDARVSPEVRRAQADRVVKALLGDGWTVEQRP